MTEDRQTPSARAEGRLATGGGVRIFGVPVRFHFTFVMLVIFLIFVGLSHRQSALATVLYILALFASVLLHELGHALMARAYGIGTAEIVMYPIGGVARLTGQPAPRQELAIAVAGPLVNLAIAGALFTLLAVQGRLVPFSELMVATDKNLLERIAAGNLILAAFNLLPAFPMDGGRVLRAALALHRSEAEATRIAARAGKVLAVLMGVLGLINMHFLLVFIAFFVYLGAMQEGAVAEGRELLHGVPVREAMVTDFRTLSHGDTIRVAADLLLSTSQQDFPVVLGDKVTGLLGRSALLRAMATLGPDGYVAGAMDRDFVRLDADMDLAEALPAMARAGSCALVMEGEDLVGMLTSENLSEFLVLRKLGLPSRGWRGQTPPLTL